MLLFPLPPPSVPQVDAYMRATSGPSKGNLIVEVIIKLLGLDVCADTGAWVGSAINEGGRLSLGIKLLGLDACVGTGVHENWGLVGQMRCVSCNTQLRGCCAFASPCRSGGQRHAARHLRRVSGTGSSPRWEAPLLAKRIKLAGCATTSVWPAPEFFPSVPTSHNAPPAVLHCSRNGPQAEEASDHRWTQHCAHAPLWPALLEMHRMPCN